MIRIIHKCDLESILVPPRSGFLLKLAGVPESWKECEWLLNQQPGAVCVFGIGAEVVTHHIDQIIAARGGMNVVTTCHDDEPFDEALWEFENVYVPLNCESKSGYVIDLG